MMNLLKEMQEQGADIPKTSPVVYCKLFEDNTGGIPLAKAPKINQKYHHFREWVKKGLIEILPTCSCLMLQASSSTPKLCWIFKCCHPLPNKGV
jgi:hypothetical protein